MNDQISSNAAVRTVDDVIRKNLEGSSSRPPDHAAENQALTVLMRELTDNPKNILQKIATMAMGLCHAQSAGLSLLEPGGTTGLMRWSAVTGEAAAIQGGTVPREATPCGTSLMRNQILLFETPARFFPLLENLTSHIHQILAAPWGIGGKVLGTVWVASHQADVRFGAEDARVLDHLSRFAAVAHSLLQRTRKSEEMRAERAAALNLMEDAVLARRETERATLALRTSEERFRAIVESAREYAIFSTDLDRNVVSWNPGAERILGYAEAEILGQKSDTLFIPDDVAAGIPALEIKRARESGSCANERWHVRKDGSRFWGSGMTMPLRGPGNETIGFLKIMRDHTEQMRAQTLLEQTRFELEKSLRDAADARDEAERAGRAKDHFLAVLSHELRTPLTPVLLAVRRLKRQNGLSPIAHESLSMIERNVQLESRLIDDLLDLTRISRGSLEIVQSPLDLHDVVRESVDIVESDLEAKKQELTVELKATRASVRGDSRRLQQVFWNLLRNASKFTPVGGKISVLTRNEPERIVVEVTDSGIGFDAEEGERIFSAFVQANANTGREFGGLGLGLAISRAIVQAHDGMIRASSPGPDLGATFTVELPRLEATSSPH